MKSDSLVRLAFLGDSISEVGRSEKWHGGASAPERNWGCLTAEILQKKWAKTVQIRHFGIGGQNTYEGLGRLDSLQDFCPDLVIAAFGANDCCHHFLIPAETRLALTAMVVDIRARFQAEVLVVGTAGDNPRMPFFHHLEETLQAQRMAASETGAPFVDMRSAILTATKNGMHWGDYHLDEKNCHPNDAGHRVWAEALCSVIADPPSALPA